MTFLPIVETLQGDITGYIQTNIISITDGQLYINSTLFREGFKPAIDLGLSVSRIGSKVQPPAVKEVGKGLRLEYAQYREMLRLTKLRTHLSAEATEKMRRGEILHHLLMQVNNAPLSMEEEVVLFYAYRSRALEPYLDSFLSSFIEEIFKYIKTRNPGLIESLKSKPELTPGLTADLDKEFADFFKELKEKGGQSV